MNIKTFLPQGLFLAFLNMVMATEQIEPKEAEVTSKLQAEHSALIKNLHKNILKIMEPSLNTNRSLRNQMKLLSLTHEVTTLPMGQREPIEGIEDPVEFMRISLDNLKKYAIWFFNNLVHENTELEKYITQFRQSQITMSTASNQPSRSSTQTEVLSSPLALTATAKREINKMTTVIVSPDGLSTNKTQEFTSYEAYMAHFFDQMRNNNNGGLVISHAMWGSTVQKKNT